MANTRAFFLASEIRRKKSVFVRFLRGNTVRTPCGFAQTFGLCTHSSVLSGRAVIPSEEVKQAMREEHRDLF